MTHFKPTKEGERIGIAGRVAGRLGIPVITLPIGMGVLGTALLGALGFLLSQQS